MHFIHHHPFFIGADTLKILMKISFHAVLLDAALFYSEVVIVGKTRQCGKFIGESCSVSMNLNKVLQNRDQFFLLRILVLFQLGVIFSASIWCL